MPRKVEGKKQVVLMMDDDLYERMRELADRRKRSVPAQALMILDSFLSMADKFKETDRV